MIIKIVEITKMKRVGGKKIITFKGNYKHNRNNKKFVCKTII